jgi:hypothetical protein
VRTDDGVALLEAEVVVEIVLEVPAADDVVAADVVLTEIPRAKSRQTTTLAPVMVSSTIFPSTAVGRQASTSAFVSGRDPRLALQRSI